MHSFAYTDRSLGYIVPRGLDCATQLAAGCLATAPIRPTPARLIFHLCRNPDVDWPGLTIVHLGARGVMIISSLQVALTATEPNVIHTGGTFHVSATARRRVRSITLRPYAPLLKNTSEPLASRELSLETAMDVLKTVAEWAVYYYLHTEESHGVC